jgi:hypothetical protein
MAMRPVVVIVVFVAVAVIVVVIMAMVVSMSVDNSEPPIRAGIAPFLHRSGPSDFCCHLCNPL